MENDSSCMMVDVDAPTACRCKKNPLTILDQYLIATNRRRRSEDNDVTGTGAEEVGQQQTATTIIRHNKLRHEHQHQEDVDEILRVADFLYGSSMMDGALSILEQASSLITCLEAPSSKRRVYIVQGSSASSSSSRVVSSGSGQQQQLYVNNYYICFIPPTTASPQQNDDDSCVGGGGSDRNNNNMMYYCSCRSFLERSRHGDNDNGSGNLLCKHLLALKLMNIMEQTTTSYCCHCHVHTCSTENEFSLAVMQKMDLGV